MRKIAVALSKGGVGKTTTAVHLAHGLAMRGCKVLLVDTDSQGQTTSLLGVENGTGLAEIIDGTAEAENAVCLARENLWLLGGGNELAATNRGIAKKAYGAEQVLSRALAVFESRFDFVILDTAPGWDALAINTLFYATEVLSPVSLEILALEGLVKFSERIDDIRQYRGDMELKYILPTFLDLRYAQAKQILAHVQEFYGDKVLEPIRSDIRLSESPSYRKTIYEYSPKSRGATDYMALVDRILKDG